MQDGGYDLGGTLYNFPPILAMFPEVCSMFPPLWYIERCFPCINSYVCILLGIHGWAMLPFFHDCPCRKLFGGKSIPPYLSGPGSNLCGKLNIFPIYKILGVLIDSGYLVPAFQERRREEGEVYEV